MADTLIKVDRPNPPPSNPLVHNRWHPDIPIAVWVKPGDDFILETYDWTGGYIKTTTVRTTCVTSTSPRCTTSQARWACGAQNLATCWWSTCWTSAPGTTASGASTAFSASRTAAAFLTDHFPLAQKSIWDFNGMFTKNRHVPGVEYAGLIHPGLIGCLPDKKMLDSGTSARPN